MKGPFFICILLRTRHFPAETLATSESAAPLFEGVFTDTKEDLPATWQWPGLWSINVPVLILLWHLLFAQSFHIWLNGYHFFATAGLAWIFVAAERWIFFFRLRPEAATTLSGDAAEQKGRMVRICLLIGAGILLISFVEARTREVAGILLWSSLGGAYLVGLRLAPVQMGEFLPREMGLAVYLSGTTALFVWANAGFPLVRLLLPAMLFLLLLFYYFCLVSRWAKPLLPTLSTGAMLEGPGSVIYRSVPFLLMAAAATFLLFNQDRAANTLLLSIGVSALILLLLDFWQRFLPHRAARILADVALLSPAVPLVVGP